MKKIQQIPRVVSVVVVPPYGLRLGFDDGVERVVDLTRDLWGPMFEPLKDPDYFAKVIVDRGTVAWPNGLDLDPLVLHGDFEPAPRPQHA
jgi:Protein of unknown function (DUF2442)